MDITRIKSQELFFIKTLFFNVFISFSALAHGETNIPKPILGGATESRGVIGAAIIDRAEFFRSSAGAVPSRIHRFRFETIFVAINEGNPFRNGRNQLWLADSYLLSRYKIRRDGLAGNGPLARTKTENPLNGVSKETPYPILLSLYPELSIPECMTTILLAIFFVYFMWKIRAIKIWWNGNEIRLKINQLKKVLYRENDDIEKVKNNTEEVTENTFHQVRNLTQLLMANLEELKAGDLKLSGYIEKQTSNIDDLVGLANRVLDNKGRNNTFLTYQNIDTLLFLYAEKYALIAKRKDLEFHYNFDSNIYVETCASYLGDIIDNLLSNSIKYTASGYVKFSAHKKNRKVVFSIEDSGCGIAQDNIFHVFKRGYRVDEKVPGSGVGLAIVQENVVLLGGNISISSSLNNGTTISVEFFAEAEEHDNELEQARGPENREPADSRSRQLVSRTSKEEVLLIEDDVELAHYYSNVLKDEYCVTIAHNGEEAIALAYRDIPNIVISDVAMEGLTGFDVVAALRRNPITRHIPLVLLTAKAGQRNRVHGFSSGANDYIVKPIHAYELRLRIRNQLNLVRYVKDKIDTNGVKEPGLDNKDLVVEKYKKLIKIHFSDAELNLENIAKKLNITKKQLERKVKHFLGITPKQYLIEYRLKYARDRLLRGEKASRTYIACGFSSHSYFSNKFKEKYGYTPSEYSSLLQSDFIGARNIKFQKHEYTTRG